MRPATAPHGQQPDEERAGQRQEDEDRGEPVAHLTHTKTRARTVTPPAIESAYVRTRPVWSSVTSLPMRRAPVAIASIEPRRTAARRSRAACVRAGRRAGRRPSRRARRSRTCARARRARPGPAGRRATGPSRSPRRRAIPASPRPTARRLAKTILRSGRLDERLGHRAPGSRASGCQMPANWIHPPTTASTARAPTVRPSRATARSGRAGGSARGRRRRARPRRRGRPSGTCRGRSGTPRRARRRRAPARTSPRRAPTARIESFEKNPESGGMPVERERADQERHIACAAGTAAARPSSACPARRASAWMTRPAARKSSALKNACVIRWNIEFAYAPRPAPRNM